MLPLRFEIAYATLARATPHLLLSLRLHKQTRAIANVGTPWSLYAMSKKMNSEEKLNTTTWWIYFYTILAVLSLVVSVLIYRFYIGTEFSSESRNWSEFGDYFGGVVGPLLSFFSFLALLQTIRLQIKALKIAREDISASKEIAEQQKESISLQRLENTFFQFINAFFSHRDSVTFATGEGLKAFTLANTIYNNYKGREVALKDQYSNILARKTASTTVMHSEFEIMVTNELKVFSRDIALFYNLKDSRFKNYIESLNYILNFVDNQSELQMNANFYIGFLKAQITTAEESFLLRFTLTPGDDLIKFPFYRILKISEAEAKIIIDEGQKFQQEVNEVLLPEDI